MARSIKVAALAFMLCASAGSLHAAADQNLPAVAFSPAANVYLVVWQEAQTVYGVRVSSAGAVLDAPPIKLPAKAPFLWTDPAVASNGRDFLVVWGDGRNGTDDDVWGAYVQATTGAVGPAGGFPIAAQAQNQVSPELAFEPVSRNFFVAWVDSDPANTLKVRGGRVNGVTSLDPAGLDLGGTSGFDFGPQVAAGNQEFLVVWNDGRNFQLPPPNTGWDIYGAFVSPAGVVWNPGGGFQISNNAENEFTPDVAYGGGNEFAIVWEDRRNGGFGAEDIYTTCLASSGGGGYTLAAPNGAPLVASSGQQRWVASTFAGGAYRYAWGDDRLTAGDHDIRGLRASHCDPLGNSLKVSGTVPGDQYFTAIAADSRGQSLVVWEDARPAAAPGHDIYGALVSPTGTVLASILIAH